MWYKKKGEMTSFEVEANEWDGEVIECDQEQKKWVKITPELWKEREVWIQPVEGEADKKGETKQMGLAFQVADAISFWQQRGS